MCNGFQRVGSGRDRFRNEVLQAQVHGHFSSIRQDIQDVHHQSQDHDGYHIRQLDGVFFERVEQHRGYNKNVVRGVLHQCILPNDLSLGQGP